jgi:hypothetical protein
MGDTLRGTYDRILQRLRDENVQKAIASVFARYLDDLQEVLVLATARTGGVRPEGLTNEIYSCFHHMARGLSEDDANPEDQFRSARDSHLKRAIFDSYKIAINFALNEDQRLRDVLDYLVLAEDFTRYIPNGLEKVNEIKDKARSARAAYCKAMDAERRGQFAEAMDEYNAALEQAAELEELISVFTKDKVYSLACAREVQKKKDKSKDRRTVILAAVVSAVLTAILTATLTLGIPALLKKSEAGGSDAGQKAQVESGSPRPQGAAELPDNPSSSPPNAERGQ